MFGPKNERRYADNPKIWGKFFGWEYDMKEDWVDDPTLTQTFVSTDAVPLPNQQIMTRTRVGPVTFSPNSGFANVITDQILTTLPPSSVPTRSRIIYSENPYVISGGGQLTMRPLQVGVNGAPVTTRFGRYFYNVNNFNIVLTGNLAAPQSGNQSTRTSVIIRTQIQNQIPIRKLKFIGITLLKREL
jgi:hypothetical protein